MDRGIILYNRLKNHIKTSDVILDYCCGISQIAEYLIDKYNYIGFDYDPDVIDKMKSKFKNATIELKDYMDIDYNPDVLMFFRSSFTDHPTKYLKSNIEKMKPRVIFLDTLLRKRQIGENKWHYRDTNGLSDNYLQVNLFLRKLNYVVVDKGMIGDNYYYYQIWRLNESR